MKKKLTSIKLKVKITIIKFKSWQTKRRIAKQSGIKYKILFGKDDPDEIDLYDDIWDE